MGKLALSFLMLFLTSCNLGGLETSLGNTPGIPSVEAPQDEEPSDGDTDPQEPQPPIVDVPITEQYPFLEEQSFWDRAAEIASIPSSKSCSNTRSYAYFGIVRLVHSFMIEGPFALFPFESDIEYYRFPDKQEPSNPLDYEIFGADHLFAKLLEINPEVRQITGKDLKLTGITKHSSFDHDLHCRHRGGNVFDMRPFPATEPMTWRSKVYDREANLEFIKAMLAWEKVELIFFNDPKILNDKEVKQIIAQREAAGDPVIFQRAGGHDNHLHIEFKIEGELDRVSTYVFDKLGYNAMIFSASDEYSQH